MNNDPKAIISKNHWDRWILAAAPPAMARIKNPDETMQMSITAWCLRPKQYPSCMARYTAITSARFGVTHHAITSEAAPSTLPRVEASHSGTTPAAIGRNRLVGCSRSASTSRTSLTKYIEEAASDIATNATKTLSAT